MKFTKVSICVGGDALLIQDFGPTVPTAGIASNRAARFVCNRRKKKTNFGRTCRGRNTKADIPLPLPELPEIPSAAHAAGAASLPYQELSSSQVLSTARSLLKKTIQDKEAIIELTARVGDLSRNLKERVVLNESIAEEHSRELAEVATNNNARVKAIQDLHGNLVREKDRQLREMAAKLRADNKSTNIVSTKTSMSSLHIIT